MKVRQQVRPRRALAAAGLALAVGVALAGCGSDSPESSSTTPVGDASVAPTGTATPDDLAGELTIFAAASLEPVLDEIATAFTAEHPAVSFAPITYDGSSTLATQLSEGAHADVFASADLKNMQTVVDAGLVVDDSRVFTTNTLQIVVPAGNPDGITSLADLATLADDGGKVVLCAVEVPCGAASQRVLDAAGVTLTPASFEQNVTAVLTKVTAGEADAGLVYRTDVLKTGDTVQGIDFVESGDAVNEYPMATLTDATDVELADAFIDFVLSDAGQALLDARGFTAVTA